MTTANIDAFIVAGGLSPWLKSYAGTEHRCLAPLGDKRLIDYIIAALQGSGRIRRIVVAARPEALALLEGTLPADVLLIVRGICCVKPQATCRLQPSLPPKP